MHGTMKAIQVKTPGGPAALEYVDIPLPALREGHVLVKAHAIGVGKPDVLIRNGTYRWMPPLPAIPGGEMVGHVEVMAPDVTGLQIGQPVLVSSRDLPVRGGCYAQYIAVPATAAIALPQGIDLDLAINIPNYQLACALLYEAARGIEPKTVFINGAAGGVASAVIDLCRIDGVSVIGSASTDEKCAFARAQGATHTINYKTENVVQRVLQFTEGRGADLVLDHVVGPRFSDQFEMLAPMGMIISFNVLGGLPEQDLFKEMRAHLNKSPAVRCFTMHTYDHDPAIRRRLIERVLNLFEAGKVRPEIFDRIPLAEARRAHELLDGGDVLGKLILKP
jgi:NADPH2:quinone reductase